jgi:alpha-beta hydrolase superfamily lysophospholipase
MFTADGLALRGTLHLPPVATPPVVVGCHGLASDSRSPKQLALATACTAQGLAYFRFDHRGCGQSEGLFAQGAALSARASDLLAAIRMLGARGDLSPAVGLFGASMGGAACLQVAGRGGIAALVTFAAPVRSRELRAGGAGRLRLRERPPSLLRDEFDLTAALPAVRAVLIFHGDADAVVPLAHARDIHRLAAEPKRLIVQENGDHLMSDAAHQEEFVREACAWLVAGLQGQSAARERGGSGLLP